MSDLIERQAVKEWLTRWEGYVDKDIIARMQYRVVDIPSAQPEPQWIPCSERLPEIKEHHASDTVICYCSNGAYAFSKLQENIFGQCGFECERDDDYYEAVGDVVAWMPLPEPYAERRTDGHELEN